MEGGEGGWGGDLLHTCKAVRRWGFRALALACACSSSVIQNRMLVLLLVHDCLEQDVDDLRKDELNVTWSGERRGGGVDIRIRASFTHSVEQRRV